MIDQYEIIARLLLGTLLGGIIGFERQSHGRPAGFRTQLLVCVACVLLMLISASYYSQPSTDTDYIRLDPTRIAAGAMTGIGFLGAGVILKTGFAIQGLTTAACIWIVAAIGLAVGAGQYLAAITGFFITFFSLWFLRIVEVRIPQLAYKYIRLVTEGPADEKAITSLFEKNGFKVSKIDYEIEFPKQETTYLFTLSTKRGISMHDLVESLSKMETVKRIEIKG